MLNGYVQRYFHRISPDLFEMYFLLAFRALAFSMIGIFLPLFLYVEKGYSLEQVVLFFSLMSVGFLLSAFMALKVVSRFGVKHSIVISYFILISSFIMLFFLDSYRSFYWFIGLFQGLSFGFFWIGFHVDATLHVRKKTLGKASGLISFSSVMGAVMGPILGAVIINFFSFNILFVVALCLFVVSFIPLLFSKDIYVKTGFDFKGLFKREHYKYILAYFAQGIRYTVAGVFWPIFAYFIVLDYLTLGWLVTIGTLFVGIIGYFIGKFSDEFGKSKMIKIFAPINAVFSSLRIFAWNTLSLFGLGWAESVSAVGIDVPLLAKTYNRAKKEEVAGFIFFREFILRLGEIFGLIIGLIIGLKLALVLAGASSLLYLFF